MKNPEKITKPGRVIGRWLAACRQHLCGPAAGLIASVMLAGDARAQVDAVQIQSSFATPWSKAAYIEAAEAYYSARYPDWNAYVATLQTGTNVFSFVGVKPCAALYRETGKAKYAQAIRAALLSIATNGDGTYTEMDFNYAYHLVRNSAEFSTADRTTIETYLSARMNWLMTQEADTTFVRGMMNATALAYAEILLLPGDPGAAAWRARHETIWTNNMLRVMDATEDSSNYGPMWLAAMYEYVRVTAPRSGVTLSAFFNRPEIRNLCERNLRAANSVGFIPSFGGGSLYAAAGQMVGTFEALATLYQDGRYKDAAWRMMNFMRTAVDPIWIGNLDQICAIPVFDYADDTLAPVAVTRPSVVAFDRNLQGRAVPDKLMMETGGLASDSSLLVNLAQGQKRSGNGSSAVATFVDQASPLLINNGGDRVSQNVMMVRAGAEAFPYVPAAAGQLGQQYINDNIRRRFTFHIRGSNGNHGDALDPRFLSRLQIYLSGALRDAANNSTFRLHIDNVRAVGASGSLLLNAGQTFFPVEGWNYIGFGGMRDLSDYDTVEFGMRIERVSPEGALYDILGFLGNDSGSNSFFFPHNFDTSSLSRVLHSQSFARAQFSAIEAQLKDTLGGDNIQRRDLLLAPGGILLARDRITFSAAQTEIQVGPVWNAAQVLSSGSRWYDLTQAKQQKLPQRSLLAYFPERTDGDTSFIHGTAQRPSSTNVVAYQKWSGSPAAGSTRTFNTLLLGHDQAQPAAALADTVQTLRCDESATLVKVGGKFLLLNPGGVSINAGGLQTDAEVLYLETSGTAVTHYSGSGASQLVFSGVTIFQGTERQVRFGSTAPVITVPETMTVYTQGNSGRVVNFGVGAADHTDGQLVPVCTPPSGSVFPVGSTTVQCSATNSLGQTSSSSFTVTVVDETVLDLTWQGGSGNWYSSNWSNGVTSGRGWSGSVAHIGNVGSAPNPITLNGWVGVELHTYNGGYLDTGGNGLAGSIFVEDSTRFVIVGNNPHGSGLTLAKGDLQLGYGGDYTPVGGDMVVNAGNLELAVQAASGKAIAGNLYANSGNVNYQFNNQIGDTATIYARGGTINLGAKSDTVGGLELASGSVISNGTLTSASTYDVRKGSISAELAGSVGLTKSTADTVTLSGVNTYTGATTIAGGTLALNGSYATPSFAIASGAVLEFNASTALNLPAVTISGTGTLRKTGPGTLVWGSSSAVFALGSGSLIDVQSGTFTGGSYANEDWSDNLSDLHVASGAAFNTVEANVRVNRLTGTGTIGTGYNGSGYQNLTIGVADGSSRFDGSITNTDNNAAFVGNLVKEGTGTIELSGSSTYTGTTTVSAGKLLISGSIASTSTVTIAAGAELEISGSLAATGNIVSHGTLILAGAQQISTAGTITLAADSFTTVSLNRTATPNCSQISTSGAMTFNGTLNVTNAGGTLQPGDRFVLFPMGGHSGTFSAINLPALSTGFIWDTSKLSLDGSIEVKGSLVIDSNLKLHLDASNPSSLVLDSNNRVSRWNDASGGANYAAQSSAAQQPTSVVAPTLGRSIMDFGPFVWGSTGQWLQFKDGTGANLDISSIRSVFVVMKGGYHILGDDNNYHFHRAADYVPPTSPLWSSSYASSNITNGQTYLNGGAVPIDGTTTPMPSGYWLASVITSGPVEASRLASDRTFGTGGQQIAEVLIYDRVLSDSERLGTEAYLMAKWFSENTLPVLTVPPPMTVEATGTNGAVVNFATTAVDGAGGSIATVNSPPSGSTFPIGSTPVTVTATDAEGYSASTTFTVTVQDSTAPSITVPQNITVEASGPVGTVVTFSTSAIDTVSGSCISVNTPASGSTFPVGTTTVNVTSSDAAGNNANSTFTITVLDSTAPSITVPANITAEASSPAGAVVTFNTSATDAVSGNCTTSNNPASGSTFPLGTTTVNVASSDAAGNNANSTFTITVLDSTAPSITLPANITVEASSPAGAVVTFNTSATDAVSGNCATSNNPASGSTFPVGTTTVNVTASDAANNNAGGSFTVTVNPWNTTPVLGAIGNQSVAQLSTLSFIVSATDSDTPAQSLTYSLDAGAPAGAVIDPSTGAFSWTPSIAQGVGNYPVTVRVADNGTPSKNASETISITVTSSLPSPWNNFDIGAVGLVGSASHAGGTFTIAGAGADIGGTADALQYVYQVGSGDCSITAKVDAVENTSSTAIAGVMIRESLAANSKQATALMTPGGSYSKYRASTGGNTTQTTGSTANRAPYWVRVTRTGNTFKMYRSPNGTTWTQIGSNRSITMAASVYIGIGVCSKVTTTLNDSTFSNVTAVP